MGRKKPDRRVVMTSSFVHIFGWRRWSALTAFSILLLSFTACQETSPPRERPTLGSTDERERGKAEFGTYCARCHGSGGKGTNQGPPLVHKIYEPNHHGDAAFQRAVAQGVRAHHWNFGDMQPVPGVSRSDVDKIVAFVRELQRENGIN